MGNRIFEQPGDALPTGGIEMDVPVDGGIQDVGVGIVVELDERLGKLALNLGTEVPFFNSKL